MSSDVVLQLPQVLAEVDVATEEGFRGSPLCTRDLSKGEIGENSDEELVEGIAKGVNNALSILFRRHSQAVLNVAWRILRDEAEAADLRQDVFLYIYQRAQLYDAGRSSASSWIMQITYHRAIDRRRYLSARQHYNVEELDEGRSPAATAQRSTDHLDGKAILEKLRGQLSQDQQQTLELHFFEGYSLREIAEKSGQSLGSVRHHYYRALERLRLNLFSKKQR